MQKLEKVYEIGKKAGKTVVDTVAKPVQDYRAQRLAKMHAIAVAAEEQQTIQKKLRFTELRSALKTVQSLVANHTEGEQADPAITSGLARAISRLARREPGHALEITQMVVANEQAYNNLVLDLHTEFAQRVSAAESTVEELKKKPLQIGTGFGRVTAALFQGDLHSLGDRATLYEDKLVLRSPNNDEAFRVVKPERFLSGENYISPGYSPFFKRLLNLVGNVISDRQLEQVEHWMPLGQVVLARSGRDEPDATVPAWFPARKAKLLNDTIETMIPPDPTTLPAPRRESAPGDLLSSYAAENIPTRQDRMKAVGRNDTHSNIWESLPKAAPKNE